MKPAFTFLAFSVAGLLALAATPATAAPLRPASTEPTDTVVLRLPNQVVMTLVVRNAAQLRELKKYQLDSLTSRLATYIDKTEAAAQAGAADQVTMHFRPDEDHPGQQLPAEVRITARKPTPGQATGSTSTEVDMQKKKYGFYTDGDGIISYRFRHHDMPEDSIKHRHHREERRGEGHIGLRYDTGFNTFVNNSAASAGVPSLRHWSGGSFWSGSGYLNFGFNFVQPLAYRGKARLAVTFGPEFAFHHFVLTGSQQWSYDGTHSLVTYAPDTKQIDYSTLNLSTFNLPVMLRFKLINKHDHKTLSAGIGAFGGIRLGSSFETQYRLAGSDLKHEDELKGPLGLRDWQYGVQGEIGFHMLRFFARYNLNELFEDGRGPQTHAFVAGFRFLGF